MAEKNEMAIKLDSKIDFAILKTKIAQSRLKDDKRIKDIIEALENKNSIPFEITYKEYTFITQLASTCKKTNIDKVREHKKVIKEEEKNEIKKDKPKKKKKKKKENDNIDEFDNINKDTEE
jgi:hypothetical protein